MEDSKLLSFKPKSPTGTLSVKRKEWDSCRHKYTIIDEAARTIECNDCHAPLDPFAVLLEFAYEQRRIIDDVEGWKARKESLLSERYDAIWLKQAGDVKEPPENPDTLKVWNIFHEYFGDRFIGMYRRKTRLKSGMEWYGRGNNGTCVSLMYARSCLTQRAIAPVKSTQTGEDVS